MQLDCVDIGSKEFSSHDAGRGMGCLICALLWREREGLPRRRRSSTGKEGGTSQDGLVKRGSRDGGTSQDPRIPIEGHLFWFTF